MRVTIVNMHSVWCTAIKIHPEERGKKGQILTFNVVSSKRATRLCSSMSCDYISFPTSRDPRRIEFSMELAASASTSLCRRKARYKASKNVLPHFSLELP